MEDRKVYTDINKIINGYVVKEEDGQQQNINPEVLKKRQETKKATLAQLDAEIKALQDKKQQLMQTEDHKPGEDYEYDYEGSMAKTQLTQITQAAEKLMSGMKDDENLPEWVQSKIAVACDYMIKVASYLDATEEQDNEAMEKKPQMPMNHLPKPPMPSAMMSSALGSKPMVGFSLGGSSSPSNQDMEEY